MFNSRPTHYTRNIADGETLSARPALLEGPTGPEAGIAIFNGKYVRFVLREDHAINLCNTIIDALDMHRTRPR